MDKIIKKILDESPLTKDFVDKIKKSNKGKIPKELITKLSEELYFNEIQKELASQLASNTLAIAQEIRESEKYSVTYNLFWIKLDSVINELFNYISSVNNSGEYSTQLQAIKDVHDSFTLDERRLIIYYRDSNCHLFQDAYLQKTKIWEDYKVVTKLKLRGVDRNDFNDSIKKEIIKYKKMNGGETNYLTILHAYIDKCIVQLINLREAMLLYSKF